MFHWRTTGESILYNLYYSRICNNIIFNYDGFSIRNRKAYRKAYYLRNPKHWQEYARNYYHQHKEQVKEYRLKNKEKKKAYRLRNREHSRQWQREYYQKNKQILKIRRYYREELKVGAEAKIDGGTASKAVTMALPNL